MGVFLNHKNSSKNRQFYTTKIKKNGKKGPENNVENKLQDRTNQKLKIDELYKFKYRGNNAQLDFKNKRLEVVQISS